MFEAVLDEQLKAGTITQATHDAKIEVFDINNSATYSTDLPLNFRESLQEKYGTYKFNDDESKDYRNARAEFGLSFRGTIAYKYKELTITTALGLFTPYAWDKRELTTDPYFQYRDMNRRFGNFDVDWDVAISYQFLKVLNVTLTTGLKYYNGTLVANKDGVLAERVQFKSVLGLGIGYSF